MLGEGVKGNGIEETIEISFDKNIFLKGLAVVNGYIMNENTYINNNRMFIQKKNMMILVFQNCLYMDLIIEMKFIPKI
jgi:hypothetical protein